jgi:hypothetical protein
MKKRTAIAVTLGVWIAAVGSAAALTYDLNRPLQLASVAPRRESPFDTANAAVAGPPPEQSVLYIPDITIVGTAPHRSSMTERPFLLSAAGRQGKVTRRTVGTRCTRSDHLVVLRS